MFCLVSSSCSGSKRGLPCLCGGQRTQHYYYLPWLINQVPGPCEGVEGVFQLQVLAAFEPTTFWSALIKLDHTTISELLKKSVAHNVISCLTKRLVTSHAPFVTWFRQPTQSSQSDEVWLRRFAPRASWTLRVPGYTSHAHYSLGECSQSAKPKTFVREAGTVAKKKKDPL